jgi:hypothetical protein
MKRKTYREFGEASRWEGETLSEMGKGEPLIYYMKRIVPNKFEHGGYTSRITSHIQTRDITH